MVEPPNPSSYKWHSTSARHDAKLISAVVGMTSSMDCPDSADIA